MMKQLVIIIGILVFMAGENASAQDSSSVWTLKNCLDYALEHNIQVKKSKVSRLSGKEDLALYKAQLFPSLSAGSSQSFVNYPSDKATSRNTYSGTYNISSNWTLFDAGKRTNTIKQSEIQQDVNDLAVQISENDIRIALVQAYMQGLYAIESVRTNENTVEVSTAQRDRSKELLDAGSISIADFAQMESQLSTDKYNLVAAQTNLDNYMLQLKQLLELDITEHIAIGVPELTDEDVLKPLPPKEEIYNTSLSVMPEIQSSKLSLDMADLDIRTAKAGYYPSIALNAGVNTGHTSGTGVAFNDQVWDRLNESIGLTLSIPIYSNREHKTAVNKAKLASVTSELNLADSQKQLLKTVEGFYLDATSSQNQYLAALEQLKSVEETFKLTEEQFFLGMKNTLELLTAKNNLLNAQQAVLQSKYMAIMSIELLNIYQNKPIKETL